MSAMSLMRSGRNVSEERIRLLRTSGNTSRLASSAQSPDTSTPSKQWNEITPFSMVMIASSVQMNLPQVCGSASLAEALKIEAMLVLRHLAPQGVQ
jgi:hypothetical protein